MLETGTNELEIIVFKIDKLKKHLHQLRNKAATQEIANSGKSLAKTPEERRKKKWEKIEDIISSNKNNWLICSAISQFSATSIVSWKW